MNIGKYEIHQYILPLMNANMFILTSGSKALIIDPNESDEAIAFLSDAGIRSITILLTHEHFDHISGVNRVREWLDTVPDHGFYTVYASAPCAAAIPDPTENMSKFFQAMFITKSDEARAMAEQIFDMNYSCTADRIVSDGDEIIWSDLKLKIRETPGHTPGSICIEIYDTDENLTGLITGDSLVEGNKVITRLPNGSKTDYRNITRPYLESIPGDTTVLPGHGAVSLMCNLELG